MSEQTPTNISNADFTFKDKYGNTGSNKGLSTDDGTKLNNMVKLMNLILNTPNSTDYINTLRNGRLPGEIVISTTPLDDANLHLADGALLSGSGSYTGFVNEIIAKYTANPNASCWTTEANWQSSVSTYGECGKYVVDTTNNTVRLPKLKSFVQATTIASEIGSLVEAGAPDITGSIDYVQGSENTTGALSKSTHTSLMYLSGGNNYGYAFAHMYLNAHNSNSIYGNSNTIQPQAIKYYFYIVVGTVSKTDIQVDIDQIATDLNGKADKDFTNIDNTAKIAMAHNAMPSNVYDNLTLGASGAEYTAPADGYFYISGTANVSGQYIAIRNDANTIGIRNITNNGTSIQFFIPIRKGDVVKVSYTVTTINWFRFVYAVGSISEQA